MRHRRSSLHDVHPRSCRRGGGVEGGKARALFLLVVEQRASERVPARGPSSPCPRARARRLRRSHRLADDTASSAQTTSGSARHPSGKGVSDGRLRIGLLSARGTGRDSIAPPRCGALAAPIQSPSHRSWRAPERMCARMYPASATTTKVAPVRFAAPPLPPVRALDPFLLSCVLSFPANGVGTAADDGQLDSCASATLASAERCEGGAGKRARTPPPRPPGFLAFPASARPRTRQASCISIGSLEPLPRVFRDGRGRRAKSSTDRHPPRARSPTLCLPRAHSGLSQLLGDSGSSGHQARVAGGATK